MGIFCGAASHFDALQDNGILGFASRASFIKSIVSIF
jgi:hypothetical protein